MMCVYDLCSEERIIQFLRSSETKCGVEVRHFNPTRTSLEFGRQNRTLQHQVLSDYAICGIKRKAERNCMLSTGTQRYTALPERSTQQGRQREPTVKTLRSLFSAKLWKHCVLTVGTQRRAFASVPERRNENKNVNKHFISSSGD